MEHVIWTNINLNPDDWDLDPSYSEEEKYVAMVEFNNEHLEDERANLDVPVSTGIFVLADLGRWNGRFAAFKRNLLYNIKDCLFSMCDYVKWYVDSDNEFRCEEHHHDGVNYLCYRKVKSGIDDDAIAELEDKIYFGTATQQDIDKVTEPLGPEIAKVYGWEVAA